MQPDTCRHAPAYTRGTRADVRLGRVEHGVTPEEVELANNPLMVLATQKRRGEERVLSAGLTDAGRALQAVYTLRRGKIRVITARTAKKKVKEKL